MAHRIRNHSWTLCLISFPGTLSVQHGRHSKLNLDFLDTPAPRMFIVAPRTAAQTTTHIIVMGTLQFYNLKFNHRFAWQLFPRPQRHGRILCLQKVTPADLVWCVNPTFLPEMPHRRRLLNSILAKFNQCALGWLIFWALLHGPEHLGESFLSASPMHCN